MTLSVSLFFLLKEGDSDSDVGGELDVFCAAGLRMPVEEVAQQYEAEYGVKIFLNYGGSGQLYGSLKLRGGDLYIPADSSYIETGVSEGMITESISLSHLTAGIVVAEGNPQGIHSLGDLARGDLKVAIAVESAAVGRFTHEVLAGSGLLRELESGGLSKFPTVNEVGAQVALGAVDAGIIWDGLMSQYDELEFINVAEFDAEPKVSAVGVMRSSERQRAALHFARYLAARDKGGVVFQKYGFKIKDGFYWSEESNQD